MQETVFYPRYTIRGSADVLSISLFLIIVLIISFRKFGLIPINIVVLATLLFFVLWFSRFYIRRIVFAPSYFLVEKYVGSSKKFDYSDVIDMGISKIKTKRGEINLAAMSNVAELHSLFFELMKQGQVDVDQSENQALIEDVVAEKSFAPTLIISAVLTVAFLVYAYYHQPRFNPLFIWLVLILIISVVSPVVHLIYKRRMNDQ